MGQENLNDNQLRLLDQNEFQIKEALHQIKLADKDIELARLKIQLANAELHDKLLNKNSKEENYNKSIEKKKEFLKSLAQELGITGRWGYDPQTGEVKITTNEEGKT